MKKNILIVLLMSITQISFSTYTLIDSEPERLVRFEPIQENSIVLPTHFAKPFIIDQSSMQELEGKIIYHIELVYTAYKQSADFDQKKLNDQRMNQLMQLIPKIDEDKPGWSLVEQTGATNAEEAKDHYHGFVIHYTDGISYHELQNYFEPLKPIATVCTIDNATGGTCTHSSGSTIVMQPNSVVNKSGEQVQGTYEIRYREYRNSAEIAVSGIPMTYDETGEPLNFSSVGMYEINATQNGELLTLQTPATINFNCTSREENVSFYQMNETGKWTSIHEIKFANPIPIVKEKPAIKEAIPTKMRSLHGETFFGAGISLWPFFGLMSSRITMTQQGDSTLVKMDRKSWRTFKLWEHKKDTVLPLMYLSTVYKKKHVWVKTEHATWFGRVVTNREAIQHPEKMKNIQLPENEMGSTMLAAGADAGHTYPTIVAGLNSPNFGVYNCDQVYRMGNTVALAPTYKNAANGQEILDKYVVCVLDLNYNGSFSFAPNRIVCNPNGRNVILLFTKDKKMFMLDEENFAALKDEGTRPIMSMTNITDDVKSSEDLKKVIGI
jgi:hypothetical protein